MRALFERNRASGVFAVREGTVLWLTERLLGRAETYRIEGGVLVIRWSNSDAARFVYRHRNGSPRCRSSSRA